MPSLHVVYARSHTLGGLLIRAREAFGQWSHCGIVTPQGTVVEALAFRGVIETPMDAFVARYPQPSQRRQEVIPCPDPDAGLAWARSQLGQGYDYLAIAGLAFRNSWQEPGRWQCAELLEAALVHAGRRRFRSAPYRISPNVSWMAQ